MSKKLTYNLVKSKIEEGGYKLLSKEYINNKSHLLVRCQFGHMYKVSLSNWDRGTRCGVCVGNKKLTYEFVKNELAKEGYTLLTSSYINNKTSLYYECPKKHKHYMSWGSWVSGNRCGICSHNKPKTIKEINKEFESEGYILLSDKYINNRTKLNFICSNGHKHSISWDSWYRGRRCKICAIKNNSAEKNVNWRGGVTSKSLCLYSTYANKISFAEDVRHALDDVDILEVKCSYCSSWFKPKKSEVDNRISVLNGRGTGECRFYCSDSCKKACPIFNKIKYPDGYKITTSREVQPELRQIVFARDNYQCQRCYKNQQEVELHCHHITGVVQNPIESADIDNCITFCKKHHEEIHRFPGCGYNDLKCNKES